MLHVRVGNVDFHDFTTNGFLIGPDGFKGWEGAPASKRDGGERTGRHGAIQTPAFKAARIVALSGHALADSSAELAHMGDVLAGVGQSSQMVVVTTEVGARWAVGSVEGEIKFDRIGDSAEASFSLSLFFPDPFKYGATHEFTPTESAFHRGNTAAVPRVLVTGTFPNGWRVTSGGQIVQVGPGTSVTDRVDFASGRVERNGLRQSRLLQQANFWTVAGGASQAWSFDPMGGSGTAKLFLTDTYI